LQGDRPDLNQNGSDPRARIENDVKFAGETADPGARREARTVVGCKGNAADEGDRSDRCPGRHIRLYLQVRSPMRKP
jgi:hypothetical protein